MNGFRLLGTPAQGCPHFRQASKLSKGCIEANTAEKTPLRRCFYCQVQWFQMLPNTWNPAIDGIETWAMTSYSVQGRLVTPTRHHAAGVHRPCSNTMRADQDYCLYLDV